LVQEATTALKELGDAFESNEVSSRDVRKIVRMADRIAGLDAGSSASRAMIAVANRLR
jgi:hypothetical protein